MPAQARHKFVRNGEIATYHCWSRCVQRAFLCGQDSYKGDDYDYRRDWMEKLLEYQAGVFAVDVGNHNVLSNHLHLIARTRPDIAAAWSDEEVACRWKMAWPEWRPDEQRWVREPTDEELELLLRNASKLAYARQGLSKCRAIVPNRSPRRTPSATEEPDWGQSGYNWEQRFDYREIVDEQALLTCMVYVDSNQIKAGMAATLEDSRTSAIAARLAAWRAREAQASLEEFHSSRGSRGGRYDLSLGHAGTDRSIAEGRLAGPDRDGWAVDHAERGGSGEQLVGVGGCRRVRSPAAGFPLCGLRFGPCVRPGRRAGLLPWITRLPT